MTTNTAAGTSRMESVVQVGILLVVGVISGAASFTHVHDWTMANSPAGTDDWFGWANAIISELTPIAAGLEARRRARIGQSITYPVALLVAAVVLSLAAQVAVAKPSITGWLISAVPALAFMALVKLVISRAPTTTTGDTATENPERVHTVPEEATRPIPTTRPTPTPPAPEPAATPVVVPEPATETVPAALQMSANLLAAQHQNATGRPIDPATLAESLGVDHTTAHRLLGTTPGTDQVPARVNGHNSAAAVTR